jgi:hypothetical protein
LRITEAQLQHAINELGPFDLGVLMMHHPLHWIDEFERAKLEQILFNHCHIIIHGHEHRPNTSRISSAFGDLVFIPAGAIYVGRTPEDPRYTNAYNFTAIDTSSFCGTVHHRVWLEELRRWDADSRFWLDGRSQFLLAKSKQYNLKLAHKSIINSNKLYMGFIGKRGTISHEITIRHDSENIDRQQFIRQHVKIRILMREGPPESFTWETGVDEMILAHPCEEVRKQAYKLVALARKMKKVKRRKEKNLFIWGGIVDPKEQWLEYEYEKLDLPNNFYFIKISRFTNRAKLSIRPAKGYQYAYLPIGGFPPLKPIKNKLLSVDTVETEDMILPSQGYIIQWRPEHKPSRSVTTSARRKSRSKSPRRDRELG